MPKSAKYKIEAGLQMLAELDYRASMEVVVAGLNGKVLALRSELRRLVAAWDASGRDVKKMLDSLPELAPYLDHHSRYFFSGKHWSAKAFPAGSGIKFILYPPGDRKSKWISAARYHFFVLLKNPMREKLAGPCAWHRCGNYFLLRQSSSRFCSRRCSQIASSLKWLQKRNKKQHAEKLQRAQKAIQVWRKKYAGKYDAPIWKRFVSDREPDITPKFLTRAVTNKELEDPQNVRLPSQQEQ